jgi:hypothetical protein
VGAYGITQGTVAAGANYTINYVGSNLTITPRPITVTADAISRLYGNSNPTLTYTVGGEGLVNNDTLTGSLATTATTASGVGAYGITQGTVAANPNYTISYAGSNLTITPRPITVTADALSRVYGNANPALTYKVGGQGLVNGDTLTGSLATTATTASGVGAYGITQGTVAANPNYTISYVGSNLTITPRPITVTADEIRKIFGTPDPALTFKVGGQGLVNNDTLTGSLTRAEGESPGAYPIEVGSLLANRNYQISFVGGQFLIQPLPPEPSLKTYAPTAAANSGPITPSASPPSLVVEQVEVDNAQDDADVTQSMEACSVSQSGVCLQTEQ